MRKIFHDLIKDKQPIMSETGTYRAMTGKKPSWSINLSSISTKLIQEVGRFCERYASDFLISWKTIENLLNTPPKDLLPHERFGVQLFAIRQDGVDGNSYFICRAKDDQYARKLPDYYRKTYAVTWKISNHTDPELAEQQEPILHICLYDLSNSLYRSYELCTQTYEYIPINNLSCFNNYPEIRTQYPNLEFDHVDDKEQPFTLLHLPNDYVIQITMIKGTVFYQTNVFQHTNHLMGDLAPMINLNKILEHDFNHIDI